MFKKYETRDERIERLHKEKQASIRQRGSEKDVGMAVGASINKAVDLVICMINRANVRTLNTAWADSDDLIAEKIRNWAERIYAISQAKKDAEMENGEKVEPVSESNEPEIPVISQ